MGLNFYVCCHKCRTKQFLYRGKESKPMHKFYHKHEECRRLDSTACQIQGDGYSEQDWMDDYEDDCPHDEGYINGYCKICREHWRGD